MLKKMYAAVAPAMVVACLGVVSAADASEANAPVVNAEPKANSIFPAPDIVGDWGGILMGALHLIVHVKKSPTGDYTAVLESVDQGHAMIPVDKMNVTNDHITFAIAAIHGSFDAKWDVKEKAWVGTWKQGRAMPLALARVNGEMPKIKRPQEEAIEAGTVPYSRQGVTFDGAAANGKLAGTFSLPQGSGPFPAVVLIAGSGPQTRDEDVLGHKVFLVLSDYLTRRGIAVLRYDKRGTGESTGDYKAATTDDFAADAEAAVAYLRSRPEVDARHIGLIGHSEGGLVAPLVAAKDPKIGFIVLLAGPAMRGDKLLAQQMYLIARAAGTPEEKAAASRKVNAEMFAAVANAPSEAEAKLRVKAIFNQAIEEHKISAEAGDNKAGLDQLTGPWMRHFLAYDPIPTLRRVTVPVLALNGTLDLQVPPKEDLEAIKNALANNKDVTVKELPKLNHLFQSASTGAPTEYGVIEETFNLAALDLIGEWVSAHSKCGDESRPISASCSTSHQQQTNIVPSRSALARIRNDRPGDTQGNL